MKFLSVLILLHLVSLKLISQEILFEKEVVLTNSMEKSEESYSFINERNKEFTIFLLDDDKTNHFLFDENYNLIKDFKIKWTKNKSNRFFGSCFENNILNLLFINPNRNKISLKTLDLNKESYSELELILNLKGEKFLEAINHNQHFYILTIKNRTSIIMIYKFDDGKLVKEAEIDLSKYRFTNDSYANTLFHVLQSVDELGKVKLFISKVDNTSPNSITLTSKKNKLYCTNNNIYITLDNEAKKTKLIKIDLNDFSSYVTLYYHQYIECPTDLYSNSNSYLYDNKLFQIIGCKDELCISINDIESGAMIKEYRAHEDKEIIFKNSNIIKKGGIGITSQNKEKEINSTKKALAKIASHDIGISAYQLRDNYSVIIGSNRIYTRNIDTYIPSGVEGTTDGSFLITPPTFHYNPIMLGFLNYNYENYEYSTNTLISFKSLFNTKSLEHIKGQVNNHAYDKINEFKENYQDNLSCFTLFKVNGVYILGHYDKAEKKYYLRKFVD